MSYTPTIIIRKKDLDALEDHIRYAEYSTIEKMTFRGRNAKEDKQNLIDAYKVLELALDYEPIKFPEIELVLLYANETSSENRRVRELLDELKIEYKLDD